jgi:hypothetical protein
LKFVLLVLYGREIWSLALKGERAFRVFQNIVLRRILGHKKEEAHKEDEDKYTMKGFKTCTIH